MHPIRTVRCSLLALANHQTAILTAKAEGRDYSSILAHGTYVGGTHFEFAVEGL